MTKKIKIQDSDFEAYFENALRSHGYLFPTTDEQMSVFEESIDYIPLPKELESPDFVFEDKKQTLKKRVIAIDNSEGERNWALAAREGKDIPEDMLAKMKRDKEEAKKKKNDNR